MNNLNKTHKLTRNGLSQKQTSLNKLSNELSLHIIKYEKLRNSQPVKDMFISGLSDVCQVFAIQI